MSSFQRALRRGPACLVLLACALAGGCAALTNPVAEDAIPVRRLPPEVLGERKEGQQDIPLALLRQKPPDVYRLAPGDILGVWIERVLGEVGQPPPVRVPEFGNAPPSLGYPVPVREDGTIPLPYVEPIKVEGLSIPEAQAEVLKAYTITRRILNPERARVIVTLMRLRQYHVLVVRQDAGTGAPTGPAPAPGGFSGGLTFGVIGGTGNAAPIGHSTGYVVDLPAYENDLLNALTRTGGLPGFEAENEILIERGYARDGADAQARVQQLERCPPGQAPPAAGGGIQVVRIPLRLRPGEQPRIRPEDVILRDGDIVFIPGRPSELYYTGGLLAARQWVLPRDYDLDVLEAVALAGGPLLNGGLNTSNLSGSAIQVGLGFDNPSLVTVLRRTAGGGVIPVRVDLNRTLRDPDERLIVRAGDVILLQETPLEAFSRYFSEQFKINLLGTFIRQRDLIGTANLNVP
jgi:hypothetical protein